MAANIGTLTSKVNEMDTRLFANESGLGKVRKELPSIDDIKEAAAEGASSAMKGDDDAVDSDRAIQIAREQAEAVAMRQELESLRKFKEDKDEDDKKRQDDKRRGRTDLRVQISVGVFLAIFALLLAYFTGHAHGAQSTQTTHIAP